MEHTAARQRTTPDLRRIVELEIRSLMGRNQVSQETLAQYLQMSQGTFSKHLRGRIAWTVDQLDALAAFFDVPLTRLITKSRLEWSSDSADLGAVPDPTAPLQMALFEPEPLPGPLGIVTRMFGRRRTDAEFA